MPTDEELDQLWREITQEAADAGVDAESHFREHLGFPAAEASHGELLAYRRFLAGGELLEQPSTREQYAFTPVGDAAPSTGGWFRVRGRGLSVPVLVRFGMVRGKPAPIGLLIDNDEEITAKVLRDVKVGQLVQDLLRWTGESGPWAPEARSMKDLIVHREDPDAWRAWDALRQAVAEAPGVETPSVGAKRGTAPNDDTLQHFARTYLRRLATDPRRAMTLAARDIPVARSTAYRWLELCRERGYLPTETETSE